MNLTCNVRIEGTEGHRAHVFIHSSQPQSIRYAQLRYMGPRQADGGYTSLVLGRYGLHFHMGSASASPPARARSAPRAPPTRNARWATVPAGNFARPCPVLAIRR